MVKCMAVGTLVAIATLVPLSAHTGSGLENGRPLPSISTFDKPATNLDGSTDFYFSPTAPKGFKKNWIPAVPGKAWFAWFRLYAPLEPYFDKTWPLPDIEKVE